MKTSFIPTATLIAGSAGVQACLTIDIKLEPLAVEVFAFYQVR